MIAIIAALFNLIVYVILIIFIVRLQKENLRLIKANAEAAKTFEIIMLLDDDAKAVNQYANQGLVILAKSLYPEGTRIHP